MALRAGNMSACEGISHVPIHHGDDLARTRTCGRSVAVKIDSTITGLTVVFVFMLGAR